MDLQSTVERYLVFWNEPNADRRAEMIAEIYTPDATQTGLFSDVTGYDGIGGLAEQLIGHLSDHRFLRSGELDIHHHVMRLPWTIVAPDSARVFAKGTDFGTFDASGRIQSIATFIDMPPEGVPEHLFRPSESDALASPAD